MSRRAGLPAPGVSLSANLIGSRWLLEIDAKQVPLSRKNMLRIGIRTVKIMSGPWSIICKCRSKALPARQGLLAIFPIIFTLMLQPVAIRAQPTATLHGKLVVGFQGWFKCPADPGADAHWYHWFGRNIPDGAHIHFDIAPDTAELSEEERCPTPLMTSRGPFNLFSDENPKTVLRQFQWMRAYGIDAAALQRFVWRQDPAQPAAFRQGWDRVLENALNAADATGRGIYVMYDVAGPNKKNWAEVLIGDWQRLLSEGVTDRPSYQRHNGRPVLAIAGLGFTDRPGTAEEAFEIIRRLREVSAPYGGLTLIGSVPTGWRTRDHDAKGGETGPKCMRNSISSALGQWGAIMTRKVSKAL
jgi:hypothetical protein